MVAGLDMLQVNGREVLVGEDVTGLITYHKCTYTTSIPSSLLKYFRVSYKYNHTTYLNLLWILIRGFWRINSQNISNTTRN